MASLDIDAVSEGNKKMKLKKKYQKNQEGDKNQKSPFQLH